MERVASMKRAKKFATLPSLEWVFLFACLALAGCTPGVGSGESNHPVEVSWDAVTAYTDGTAIEPKIHYRLYAAPVSGEYSEPPVFETDSTSAALILSYPTTFLTVTAVDSDGMESDHSNELEVSR